MTLPRTLLLRYAHGAPVLERFERWIASHTPLAGTISIAAFVGIFALGEGLGPHSARDLDNVLFTHSLLPNFLVWIVLGNTVFWIGLYFRVRVDESLCRSLGALGVLRPDDLAPSRRLRSFAVAAGVTAGVFHALWRVAIDRGEWAIWEAPQISLPLTICSFVLVHTAVASFLVRTFRTNIALTGVFRREAFPLRGVGREAYSAIGRHYWLVVSYAVLGIGWLSITTYLRTRTESGVRFDDISAWSLFGVTFVLACGLIAILIFLPLWRQQTAVRLARRKRLRELEVAAQGVVGRTDATSLSQAVQIDAAYSLLDREFPEGPIPRSQLALLRVLAAAAPLVLGAVRIIASR